MPSLPSLPSLPSSSTEEIASKAYESLVQRNLGLGNLFHDQTQKTPHAQAVIDGGQVLTYAQLHYRSLRLALKLQQSRKLISREPIGILVDHGVNDIIAQIAVLYVGGTCVPLDPTFPHHQLESRLSNVNAQAVIVDSNNKDRLSTYLQAIIDEENGEPNGFCSKADIPTEATLDDRTHLLYTSGTTGEPKTVQVVGRAITQVACYLPSPMLDAADRVAHVNNTTFDISLFEIWAPLLRGATIVVLDRKVLLDPVLLAETIEHFRLTHFCPTAAVLNIASIACPSAFSPLKMLTSGGEAPNKNALQKILEHGPPEQLINCYGPTECTIISLIHRLTPDDIHNDKIGIGKPLGRTFVYILDEAFSPVPTETVGELFIGGDGVSPGYLNQPEKNAKSFVLLPGLSLSGEPIRLYRTGDLVKRRKSGLIEYCGRRDNQVKIRGYRIELEAIEAALMSTGRFSAATALKVDSPQDGAGAVLVAFAVPVTHDENLLSDARKALQSILPSYMVPQLELADALPLNSHGKVDRKKLATLNQEALKLRQHNIALKETNDILSGLRAAWLDILATASAVFDPKSDFFELGGTSLQAAILLQQIRRDFGAEISSLALYENSTLSALARLVEESRTGQLAVKDERELWLSDATLGQDLSPSRGRLRDWRTDIEGRVMLTGATGFVGAHFLRKILELPYVLQVGCLVRARGPAHGLSRIRQSLEKYSLWDETVAWKLLALPGNLQDEHLGLERERFAALAEWASVVYHLAAHVNYTQPYSVHRPSNVIGTVNVLRFVAAGRVKALHYVSSISAFGPTGMINGTTYVSEAEPLLPHLNALPYDHGYTQSQWVVEKMLWTALDRGFHIAIYRPGFVTGSSAEGINNLDDFFSRLMTACISMGCYPRLSNQRKELVTVDWVVSAILHISGSEQNLGQAYHLVPHHTVSTDLEETFRLVSANGFPNMQGLPYSEWIERLKLETHERLLPLFPMLQEKVYNGLTRWEMHEHMPTWGTENARRALADRPDILNCRHFDVDLAALFLKQWASPDIGLDRENGNAER